MGITTSKKTETAESKMERQRQADKMWEEKNMKRYKENTDWNIAELTAFWEEGRKRGELSVKWCAQPELVKQIMREKDIHVMLRQVSVPMDIDDRFLKTYFIMSKIESRC